MHPQIAQVQANITFQSGAQQKVALRPCPPGLPPLDWKELTEAEADIFYSCIHEQDYLCPHCHARHPASQVWLPCVSSTMSRPLYSSLHNKRGLLLLKDNGFCVRYSSYGYAALRVGDAGAAFREHETFALYNFTVEKKKWKATGQPLAQYQKIADGLYAILL